MCVGGIERCALVPNVPLLVELREIGIDLTGTGIVVEVVKVDTERARDPACTLTTSGCTERRAALVLQGKRHPIATGIRRSEVHLRRNHEVLSQIDGTPDSTALAGRIRRQLIRRSAH